MMPSEQKPGFEQVYEDYFHRLYAYVASHMENPKDAEDIVADIFIKVMQNLRQYRGGNLSSWLFTIAHNSLQDWFRKQKIQFLELEDEFIEEHENPEQAFLTNENSQEILKQISSLSLRRQEVITLRFYAQLRNQEIAEVLGINEQSVASTLHRALVDLRARLRFASPDKVEKQ